MAIAVAEIWLRKLLRSRAVGARASRHRTAARSHHQLTVPVLLLALGFSALCGLVLWQAHSATETRAVEVATSLAGSLRSQIERNVDMMNLTLEAVANNLKLPALASLSADMRQLVLFDHNADPRDPTTILVLDEAGRVKYDARRLSPPREDLSDRDYFLVHKDGDAGLFISQPFASRITGRTIVAFSRRLSRPDGSFAGVVVGAMLQDYFRSVFADIPLGAHGTVTLARADGVVLMRWPHQPGFVGSSIRHS